MVTEKKRGGPQTIAGKAISSKNSTKYGLTSSKPSSPKEQEVVKAYVQELTTHYKPASPLEKLQIERIAICKVKLDRLYEVEQIQLELATEKFSQDPGQILDRISGATGTVRGMVKELIEYGEITLPCNLKNKELELICEEIIHYRKNILKESDIKTYWPNLTAFLITYHSIGVSDTDNLTKKLDAIAEKIENLFRSGDEYRERFQNFVEIIIKAKEMLQPDPEPPTEEDLELEQLLEKQRKTREAERFRRHPPKVNPEPITPTEPLIDQAKFTLQLRLFSELLEYRNQSYEIHRQYESFKVLMIRGMTLPQQESDLMMRYQTALDRRLSTAIGELLHLQSQNNVITKRTL